MAFHFVHNSEAYVNAGAYCCLSNDNWCIMIESSTDLPAWQRFNHLVIGKFKYFSLPPIKVSDKLSWPFAKSDYHATVLICSVQQNYYKDDEWHLRGNSEIQTYLHNVHSSTIIPTSSSFEKSEIYCEGIPPVTMSSKKVLDLELFFKNW
jgi:hypothetical protein